MMTETINDNLSETDSPAASVDPIATAILDALNADEPGAALDPQVIARRIAESRAKKFDPPDLWRRYLPAVRHQALFLARRGQIVILRKGKAADPNAPIKGLIKLTLPGA